MTHTMHTEVLSYIRKQWITKKRQVNSSKTSLNYADNNMLVSGTQSLHSGGVAVLMRWHIAIMRMHVKNKTDVNIIICFESSARVYIKDVEVTNS